jgi:hypothetical protein
MADSYAPVNLAEFKLTIPVTGPVGDLRLLMGSSDRPWCTAVAAEISTVPAKIGGRVGSRYVRDIGVIAASLELGVALRTTLPDQRRNTWGSALRGKPLLGTRVPGAPILGKTLDQYQLDAASKLSCAGGVIALSVGLGKTLIALEATRRALAQQHRAWNVNLPHGTVMVVCPLNAMPVWTDPAVEDFIRQTCNANYMVQSIDSLHKVQAMQVLGPSVLIIDEAHYVGDWKAQRTKLAHKLRWQFDVCLPLTGSMLHAGPEKVLSLLDLACPGAAIFENVYSFGGHFECLYPKDIGNGVIKKTVGRPPAKYAQQFQAYLDRFVVAKTKRSPDVMTSLYVPEQEITEVCLFDPNGPSMLDEAANMALELFQNNQTAGQPNPIPSMIEVVHALSRAGLDDKLDWLAEMMDGFTEQVVLFGTYHDTLNPVEDWLKSLSLPYCRIDGAVTGDKRSAIIDDFRAGKYQIMLAQTDAASVSMNLQTARVSVMLDATLKAAAFEQALGRTCRRGSTDLCHHFNTAGNRFQQYIFKRLKNAMDFNASVAEWQDAKRLVEQTLTQGAIP